MLAVTLPAADSETRHVEGIFSRHGHDLFPPSQWSPVLIRPRKIVYSGQTNLCRLASPFGQVCPVHVGSNGAYTRHNLLPSSVCSPKRIVRRMERFPMSDMATFWFPCRQLYTGAFEICRPDARLKGQETEISEKIAEEINFNAQTRGIFPVGFLCKVKPRRIKESDGTACLLQLCNVQCFWCGWFRHMLPDLRDHTLTDGCCH